MKQITSLFLALLISQTVFSQGIFDASIHTANPFGDVSSPAAESSQEIIDQEPSTKFLDFNNTDGMGFEVDMLGVSSIVNSIEIVTANDAPERDPIAYELFGSNDGISYELIIADDIPCVADRFLSRTFGFANNDSYTFYIVNFTGNCATTDITQVADVQLYPIIGNAPVINCADDMQVENSDGKCGAIVDYEVTATDVEDGTLAAEIVSGLASGSEFPIGTSSIIYSVVDSDNNVVTCGFTITVTDTENPNLQCSDDIEVGLANPNDTEVVAQYSVQYFDNCSVINPLEGYTSLGTIEGRSYYLSDELFLAEDAFNEAVVQGGLVGSILSAEDNQTILDWIKLNNNGVADILIGLNDVQYEGVFLWPNEEYADYTNWNENEPNNSGAGGGPENYVSMLTDGRWNDVDNTVARRYLLELNFELLQTEGLASGANFPLGITVNTFEIYDAAGNSSTCSFQIEVKSSVNTAEYLDSDLIQISPNPAFDFIKVENQTNYEFDQATIINRQGQVIQKWDISNNSKSISLDITDFNTGLFFIKLDGEQKSIVQKFVVLK